MIMNKLRPIRPPERAWLPTTPGDLAPLPAQADSSQAVRRREQPPLREVFKGLDVRELEGQTVFDQLFGPQPVGDPRLVGR